MRSSNPEEVGAELFWWSSFLLLIGPGFSNNCAASLHRKGLRQIRDSRVGGRFLTVDEARVHFGLLPGEAGAWLTATRALQTYWGHFLTQAPPHAGNGEWIGWYPEEDGLLPLTIVKIQDFGVMRIGAPPQTWPGRFDGHSFVVLPSARILQAHDPKSLMLRDAARTGSFHRVRVVPIQCGPKKTEVFMFYGRVDQIRWDPLKYEWNDGLINVPLMSYSAKLGRKLLMNDHRVPNLVVRKWGGALPDDFRLRWKTV